MGEMGVVFLIFRDAFIVSDVCSILGVGWVESSCCVASYEGMAGAAFVFKSIAKLQYFSKIKGSVINMKIQAK